MSLARAFPLAVLVLLVLGLASYFTTSRDWDGGFPPAELRITILDKRGHPVPGAVLQVYHGGTQDRAISYPIYEEHLRSDEQGHIVCHQIVSGFQFGGHAWRLFWLIPIGAKAPRFDCVVSAIGYESKQLTFRELLNPIGKGGPNLPTTKVEINRELIEMRVVESIVILD
jgi:hypothetical protein